MNCGGAAFRVNNTTCTNNVIIRARFDGQHERRPFAGAAGSGDGAINLPHLIARPGGSWIRLFPRSACVYSFNLRLDFASARVSLAEIIFKIYGQEKTINPKLPADPFPDSSSIIIATSTPRRSWTPRKATSRISTTAAKMMITLGGAMSTAELGLSLAEMIRQDKVHLITCTGANLEEDVFNLVAHDYYERVPGYR